MSTAEEPAGAHIISSLGYSSVLLYRLNMSGPYDHAAGINAPEMVDHAYPVYDGQFSDPYSRLAGPPTHFDGVGFWYRPNNADPLYERDPQLFARGGAASVNSMEHSSVKHRRTRSGCFTCRSRRVKVC